MTRREQIVEEALRLSPEDRAYVAGALEGNLASSGFASPELAAEWSAEIDRRLAAYDRGELSADGARTSLERIRLRLHEHTLTQGEK